MSKKQLKAAKATFTQHKELEKVFITSDGFAFTAKHRAEGHAQGLKNKDVEEWTQDEIEGSDPSSAGFDSAGFDSAQPPAGEREDLLKTYEELYGREAPKKIKVETLKERIAEKEAEPATEADAE